MKYYLGRMSIVVILLTVAAQSSGYAEQGITAQQRVFLFSGAAIGSGQELLANEFRDRLDPDFNVQVSRSVDNASIIESISEDPAVVGLVRLDFFADYLSQNPDALGKFDLYGEVPICIFAAVRSNDSEAGENVPSSQTATQLIDLGPQSDKDTMFMIESIWPEIKVFLVANPPIFEFLGGYRALDRVAKGLTEAAIFVAMPEHPSPRLNFIHQHPGLKLAGMPTRPSAQGDQPWNDLGSRGYIPTTVSVQLGGWLSKEVRINTVCSSLGLLVNNETLDLEDHRYVDAVVSMISTDSLVSTSRYEKFRAQSRTWLQDFKSYAQIQLDKGVSIYSDVKAKYFLNR